MQCERCEELLASYQEAARRFGMLTRRLADAVDFERELIGPLWNHAQEVRQECETLRQVILTHLQTHHSRAR
jgi:RNase adaptor protein for sRNA GlmZ degradation